MLVYFVLCSVFAPSTTILSEKFDPYMKYMWTKVVENTVTQKLFIFSGLSYNAILTLLLSVIKQIR